MSDSEAAAVVENDLSGRQLGDYQLLRRLGRGAMAEVYLAEQGSLRRQVAVKILKSELAGDQTYVKRFHMEAQAAASLVHANIVQIHDVGCIDGVHYIAQEYVQGLNLREYVSRNGPPDSKLAAHIMRQVTAALHRASEQGIVHRDIKPENIMLAKTGEVKVADFGLARMMRDTVATDLTQVGMTMGTPLYMSPEQVEGRSLDGRSDIYSFGVTSYYMLTGQPPFRGDTALSVALQHLNAQPPRLETLRADLEPGLCRIVHQMLAKDPDSRFRTARDLLREIRSLKIDGLDESDESGDWSPGEPIGNLRLEATQQLATLMKSQASLITRRKWLQIAMLVGVIAFLIGATSAYMTRPKDLLAGVEPSTVERLDTAIRQYNFAKLNPSVESWRAVVEYFGDSKLRVVPQAKEELALLYLMNGNHNSAMALFKELSAHVLPRYRAFGFSGQAVVLDYLGKREESGLRLKELYLLTGGEQPEPEQFAKIFEDEPTTAELHMMIVLGSLTTRANQQTSEALRQRWLEYAESLNSVDESVSGPPVDNTSDP